MGVRNQKDQAWQTGRIYWRGVFFCTDDICCWNDRQKPNVALDS